jgi:hypothetical protein
MIFKKRLISNFEKGIGGNGCDENLVLNDLKNLLDFTRPGPHLFVFVITVLRFTEEDKRCINLLGEYFGKNSIRS